MGKVLIVDDDVEFIKILSEFVESKGHTAIAASDGKSAIQEFYNKSPDLVLLDYILPDMDGFQIFNQMDTANSRIPIIMLTANGDILRTRKAFKEGVFDFLPKPIDYNVLSNVIDEAFSLQQYQKVPQDQDFEELDNNHPMKIICKSQKMKVVIDQAYRVANGDIAVLLYGETGSGKEVIALLIHSRSRRNKRPFVPIGCGAIPESLAESMFLGHEKGSFSGADAATEGLFEQANGGILLLDDIINLPHSIQSKLLRALESNAIWHIGGKREIAIDVRIISTTNRNLYTAVTEGKFRLDLYYRINKFIIHIPPLRERIEDIPLLANIFVEEFSSKYDKNIKEISPKVYNILLNHCWPGNVRELKSVMEQAVIETKANCITSINLSEFITNNNYLPIEGASLSATMGKVEHDAILNALKDNKWNQTKAAKILGVDRKTLYRKIKNYKIR